MEIERLEKRINKGGTISYWKDGAMVGKKCTKCGEDKKVSEFGFTNKKKGIYHPVCKECEKEYKRKRYKNNPDKMKGYNKKWQKNNLDYYRRHYEKRFKNMKQENLKNISNMIEQINPILKELPIYGYIYKFENIRTGRVYIGQTVNALKMRYHNSNIVQGWVKDRKRYDNQKFKEELIEEDIELTEILDVACCQYHLDKLEAYYIDKYDSCNNGYNNNAGYHHRNDGVDEFNEILEKYNLEFIDNELRKIND